MILYNVSFIDRDGLRVLMGPAQGRCMRLSRSEAEQYLQALLESNPEDRLASVFGAQAIGSFRVDAFDCWDHGDPKSIYVEDRSFDEAFVALPRNPRSCT